MKIVSDTGNDIYSMGNYKKIKDIKSKLFANNLNIFKFDFICRNYSSTGPWEQI